MIHFTGEVLALIKQIVEAYVESRTILWSCREIS